MYFWQMKRYARGSMGTCFFEIARTCYIINNNNNNKETNACVNEEM